MKLKLLAIAASFILAEGLAFGGNGLGFTGLTADQINTLMAPYETDAIKAPTVSANVDEHLNNLLIELDGITNEELAFPLDGDTEAASPVRNLTVSLEDFAALIDRTKAQNIAMYESSPEQVRNAAAAGLVIQNEQTKTLEIFTDADRVKRIVIQPAIPVNIPDYTGEGCSE